MSSGYYRYPTIGDESVVFVCEDDLWTVPATGGIARRLTSGLATATYPILSPDGRWLAFTGREEGQPEVYLMPGGGGPAKRLTYLGGGYCRTVTWDGAGRIVFANSASQPFGSLVHLYALDPQRGDMTQIGVGPARTISYSAKGGVVIGRNIGAPAMWKRYRGGRTGQIWIDEKGEGDFQRLRTVQGNLASPIWIGERIYFLSDHEGIGNLYSCLSDGQDVRRHTDHEEYYARNASSDGRRIVYHAGGDLYLFDPETDVVQAIEVDFRSPQTQRNRRFVDAARYLDSYALHPKGHTLAITSRGKAFTMANWEGPVLQHGQAAGPRYRLLDWLNDGKRLIGVTDEPGEEAFVIMPANGLGERTLIQDLDIGRPDALAVSPTKDQILFSNHRFELCLLDLDSRELTVIDRGKNERIAGFCWSPDGRWAAYSVSISLQVTVLKLWQAETGQVTLLTDPVLRDVAPAFDPSGRYLYFLSYRHFDPVYDNLQFDLGFPMGMRPFLITLRKEDRSPFSLAEPAESDEQDGREEGDSRQVGEHQEDEEPETGLAQEEPDEAPEASEGAAEKPKEAEPKRIQVDLDGIERRIVGFPVDEGRYGRIEGIGGGKVIYSRYPVEGALGRSFLPSVPPAKGELLVYDFEEQTEDTLITGISDFVLSSDHGHLGYRAGNRLRVLKAGQRPNKEAGSKPGPKSGWVDLGRIKVSIVPGIEWQQMYREAWRLQRDHFWTPDMANVDWLAVYERYLPLVERAASRSEFSDLIWEMQGELGTSHSYEFGGDYRPEPRYDQGYLGADLVFDDSCESWRVERIVQGDAWDEDADSPLRKPGINVAAGDRILAINGRPLSRLHSPGRALVNLAGEEITLAVARDDQTQPRLVTVRALRSEEPARYREWVTNNRRIVHEATGGRVGYIHIPDMMAAGYAEFHRGYLAEVDREGLIVDVRFNNGGHVSSLILEKLARKRLGYEYSRWGEDPLPYPVESVLGPMVALTNEQAGSDGDIFSHGFKMLGLGPLIGMRTWGGVVGISPKATLVDGSITTQPEYSTWFTDVGWGIENYGTEPDIEVEIRPQDYGRGLDPQLQRAIEEIQRLLAEHPPQVPDLGRERPNLALPKLPPRT